MEYENEQESGGQSIQKHTHTKEKECKVLFINQFEIFPKPSEPSIFPFRFGNEMKRKKN